MQELDFLGFESFRIDLGADTSATAATIKAALLARGFQCLMDGNQMRYNTAMTFEFPATGGSQGAYAFLDDLYYGAETATLPCHLGLDFGRNVTPASFRIWGGNAPTYNPRDFVLQFSDNGTTWTDKQTYSKSDWTVYEVADFAITSPEAHRYWRIRITARNGATSTRVYGLAFLDAAGNRSCPYNMIPQDWIPPVGQTIGNEHGYGFIRLRFFQSSISYSIKRARRTALPLFFIIRAKNGGTSSNEITINGVTIAQDPATLNAANTSFDNLGHLFQALKESANPEIANWQVDYIRNAMGAGNESSYISIMQKVPAAGATYSGNANITVEEMHPYIPAGRTDDWSRVPEGDALISEGQFKTNIDHTNGYIYYIGIYPRGFSIATKTNAGFYGAITCEWADNDAAKAAMPTPINPWLTPCEVFITSFGSVNGVGGTYTDNIITRTQHLFAIGNNTASYYSSNDPHSYRLNHPFGKIKTRAFFHDASDQVNGGTYTNLLASSGIFYRLGIVGDDFQIHRATSTAISTGTFDDTGAGYTFWINVPSPLKYAHVCFGSVNNEQLLMVNSIKAGGKITQNLDDITDYPAINIDDTSLLQPSGFVIINEGAFQEVVKYTGKTATSITGCTRAMYATTKRKHWSGDSVKQGLWFVKFNNSAIFAGYERPS